MTAQRPSMQRRTEVVVLDVNETLSDMRPLARRFEAVGFLGSTASLWFASVLRDGFAAAAAGTMVHFGDLASDALTRLLRAEGHDEEGLAEHVSFVLAGLPELDVHSDVEPGLRALAQAGLRLVTLTNGASALSEGMLARAGVLDLLEHRLSVEDVGRWKPAPEPYRFAADRCGVPVERAALVAVHPWDVHGAQRAGLLGVWLDRKGLGYPSYLPPPDVTVRALTDLPDRLPAAG